MITFAIVCSENTWRTDFTIRNSEYYAHKFGGEVVLATSIDSALKNCKTPYIVIQKPGHVILNETFFKVLPTLVLGRLISEYDSIRLSDECLFINVNVWKSCGCPKFISSITTCTEMIISKGDRFDVQQIKFGTEQILIDHEATGTELLVKQLELYGVANTLNEHRFLIDGSSPYRELISESKFSLLNRSLPTFTDCDVRVPNVRVDTIISSGEGAKPYLLTSQCKAKRLIIFNSNEEQLEQQRNLLSVKKFSLLNELIQIDGDQGYIPIGPLELDVEFIQLDITSHEAEQLIKSIRHDVSLLVDFGRQFVIPNHYYKKPLYQVQALFNELFSLLKSRVGKTFVCGYGPRYVDLFNVKINTSTYQYDGSIKDTYTTIHEEPVKQEELSFEELTDEPVKQEELFDDELIQLLDSNGYSVDITPTEVTGMRSEEFRSLGCITYRYTITDASWSFLVTLDSVKWLKLFDGVSRQTLIESIMQPSKFNPYSVHKQLKECYAS